MGSCSPGAVGGKALDPNEAAESFKERNLSALVWAMRGREGSWLEPTAPHRSHPSTHGQTKRGKGPDPLYLLWQYSSQQKVGTTPGYMTFGAPSFLPLPPSTSLLHVSSLLIQQGTADTEHSAANQAPLMHALHHCYWRALSRRLAE